MSLKAKKPKLWSVDELERIYKTTPNKKLGERLLYVLKWADRKGSLIEDRRYYPQFGLRGKSGIRIMSFWSPEKHHTNPPGSVHIFINPQLYASTKERDMLLEKLNKLLHFSDDLDKLNLGKTSEKSLADLSEDDFSTFLRIVEEYSY